MQLSRISSNRNAALARIAAMLSALLLTPCGAAGFVVTGQLIDGETGKPMPNAWVHQEWMLSERISLPIEKGGAGTFPCVDEQVVRTDAKGNFRFEQPPKLRYNPITRSASAYVTPLIPGYDIDRDKSKNQGESHQVVVAKKYTGTMTREYFLVAHTGLLAGGGRCSRVGEGRRLLSQQMSDETADALAGTGVSLEEIANAYRSSNPRGPDFPIRASEVKEMLFYKNYQKYLEQRGSATK